MKYFLIFYYTEEVSNVSLKKSPSRYQDYIITNSEEANNIKNKITLNCSDAFVTSLCLYD